MNEKKLNESLFFGTRILKEEDYLLDDILHTLDIIPQSRDYIKLTDDLLAYFKTGDKSYENNIKIYKRQFNEFEQLVNNEKDPEKKIELLTKKAMGLRCSLDKREIHRFINFFTSLNGIESVHEPFCFLYILVQSLMNVQDDENFRKENMKKLLLSKFNPLKEDKLFKLAKIDMDYFFECYNKIPSLYINKTVWDLLISYDNEEREIFIKKLAKSDIVVDISVINNFINSTKDDSVIKLYQRYHKELGKRNAILKSLVSNYVISR